MSNKFASILKALKQRRAKRKNPLVKGSKLNSWQREAVKRMYVHRFTGQHRPQWSYKPMPSGAEYRPTHETDDAWIDDHAFYLTKGGKFDSRRGYAEPHYMADNPSFMDELGPSHISVCRDMASNPYVPFGGRDPNAHLGDDSYRGYRVGFSNMSWNCKALGLWGYSTFGALAMAIDRKLDGKRKSKNPNYHNIEGSHFRRGEHVGYSDQGVVKIIRRDKNVYDLYRQDDRSYIGRTSSLREASNLLSGLKKVSSNPELLMVGLNPPLPIGGRIKYRIITPKSGGDPWVEFENDKSSGKAKLSLLGKYIGASTSRLILEGLKRGVHSGTAYSATNEIETSHGSLTVNPQGGSAMELAENPRGKRRKTRRYRPKMKCRRVRRKHRSWRAYVRKHKGLIKRLGLKRGIRKIAHMWKRAR